MFSVINQRNVSQNHSEASPQNGHHQNDHKQQMLATMRGMGNPPAPLAGIQIGAAIEENSTEFPQTKNRATT